MRCCYWSIWTEGWINADRRLRAQLAIKVAPSWWWQQGGSRPGERQPAAKTPTRTAIDVANQSTRMGERRQGPGRTAPAQAAADNSLGSCLVVAAETGANGNLGPPPRGRAACDPELWRPHAEPSCSLTNLLERSILSPGSRRKSRRDHRRGRSPKRCSIGFSPALHRQSEAGSGLACEQAWSRARCCAKP